MASSSSARAAILRAYKSPFSGGEITLSELRADEVRVRIVSSGICDTGMVFRDGDGFALPIRCVLVHEGTGSSKPSAPA